MGNPSMKRLSVPIVVFSLLVSAPPSSAFPIITCDVINAVIQPLDLDSYRIEMDVSWGWSGLGSDEGISFSTFMTPTLLGNNQYNPSESQGAAFYPGLWFTYHPLWDLAPPFSYDFDAAAGLGYSPISLEYSAMFLWWQEHWNGSFYYYDILGEIWVDDGSFTVLPPVPEPPTGVLFALALAGGVGALRRHRVV
jgi:hypothetical protein